MRRAVGAETRRSNSSRVSFEDRLQYQQGCHLHHPVPHCRDSQRPHLSVGFRYVHAAHWLRPVGLRSQGFPGFLPETPPRRFPALRSGSIRHAVDARCALIGAHPPPCLFQCVPPIDPVVQHIEPELRFTASPSDAASVISKREFLRHPGVIRACGLRVFRSGVSQAVLTFLLPLLVLSAAPLAPRALSQLPGYYRPL